MKGLLIDTSSQTALLALTENGEVTHSHVLEGAKTLSSKLFPTLESLLKQGGLKVQDLNFIGVGIGPGSYMGIRTAASIAKTLSFGTNVPLVEFFSPFAFLPDREGTFTIVGDGKLGKLFVLTGTKKGAHIDNIEGPLLVEKGSEPPYLEKKDFILEGPSPLNAKWLASYVYQLHLEGKSHLSPHLKLAYLH